MINFQPLTEKPPLPPQFTIHFALTGDISHLPENPRFICSIPSFYALPLSVFPLPRSLWSVLAPIMHLRNPPTSRFLISTNRYPLVTQAERHKKQLFKNCLACIRNNFMQKQQKMPESWSVHYPPLLKWMNSPSIPQSRLEKVGHECIWIMGKMISGDETFIILAKFESNQPKSARKHATTHSARLSFGDIRQYTPPQTTLLSWIPPDKTLINIAKSLEGGRIKSSSHDWTITLKVNCCERWPK